MSIPPIRDRMINRLVEKGYKHIDNMFIKKVGPIECFVSITKDSYFLYKKTRTTTITATAKTKHRCYNKFVRMTNV